MGKTPEQRLSDIYISNFYIIGEGFPAPLNSARRGFLEDFNLAGLPTTHDEKYRHTDLQKLFEPDYELYFTPPSEAVEITDRLPVSGYEVNVLNGFTARGTLLSIDASGLAFGSLKAAAVQMEDVVS